MAEKLKKPSELTNTTTPEVYPTGKSWVSDSGVLVPGMARNIEPIKRSLGALESVTDNLVDGVWDGTAINDKMIVSRLLAPSIIQGWTFGGASSYNVGSSSSSTYSTTSGFPTFSLTPTEDSTMYVLGMIALSSSQADRDIALGLVRSGHASLNGPMTRAETASTTAPTITQPVLFEVALDADTVYSWTLGVGSGNGTSTIYMYPGRSKMVSIILPR